MTEIKPCPHCGGEAQRFTLTEDDGPDNAGGDVITCTRCGACSHVEFGRKENLVSRWNTRTPDPSLLNGLREAREALADATAFIRGDISGPSQRNGILRDARTTLAHLDTLLAQEGEG